MNIPTNKLKTTEDLSAFGLLNPKEKIAVYQKACSKEQSTIQKYKTSINQYTIEIGNSWEKKTSLRTDIVEKFKTELQDRSAEEIKAILPPYDSYGIQDTGSSSKEISVENDHDIIEYHKKHVNDAEPPKSLDTLRAEKKPIFTRLLQQRHTLLILKTYIEILERCLDPKNKEYFKVWAENAIAAKQKRTPGQKPLSPAILSGKYDSLRQSTMNSIPLLTAESNHLTSEKEKLQSQIDTLKKNLLEQNIKIPMLKPCSIAPISYTTWDNQELFNFSVDHHLQIKLAKNSQDYSNIEFQCKTLEQLHEERIKAEKEYGQLQHEVNHLQRYLNSVQALLAPSAPTPAPVIAEKTATVPAEAPIQAQSIAASSSYSRPLAIALFIAILAVFMKFYQ